MYSVKKYRQKQLFQSKLCKYASKRKLFIHTLMSTPVEKCKKKINKENLF